MPSAAFSEPHVTFPSLPGIMESGMRYELTEAARSAFTEGGPKQGYIGIAELPEPDEPQIVKIHLLPADNKNSGTSGLNKDGLPFSGLTVQSQQELGSMTGDLHTQAVAKLKLGHKGGIHGKILGFGLWKSGLGVRFVEELPAQSGRLPNEVILVKKEGQPAPVLYFIDAKLNEYEMVYQPGTDKWNRLTTDKEFQQQIHDSVDIPNLMDRLTHLADKSFKQIDFETRAAIEQALRASRLGELEAKEQIGSARNRSSSQNTFAFKYSDIYRLYFSEAIKRHGAHAANLIREIPQAVFQDLLNGINEGLGLPPFTNLEINPIIPGGWVGPQYHLQIEKHWQNMSAEEKLYCIYQLAISYQHPETLRLLHARGDDIDLNEPIELLFETPVFNMRVLNRFEERFGLKKTEADKIHPLHYAAGINNLELVTALLEAGADPLIMDRAHTAIDYAKNNAPMCLAMLIHIKNKQKQINNFVNLYQKYAQSNPEFVHALLSGMLDESLKTSDQHAFILELWKINGILDHSPIVQLIASKIPETLLHASIDQLSAEQKVLILNPQVLSILFPRVQEALSILDEVLKKEATLIISDAQPNVAWISQLQNTLTGTEQELFDWALIKRLSAIPGAQNMLLQTVRPSLRLEALDACIKKHGFEPLTEAGVHAFKTTLEYLPEEMLPARIIKTAMHYFPKEQSYSILLPMLAEPAQLQVIGEICFAKTLSHDEQLSITDSLELLPLPMRLKVLRVQDSRERRTLLETIFSGHNYPRPEEIAKTLEVVKKIITTLPNADKVLALADLNSQGISLFHYIETIPMLAPLLELIPEEDRITLLTTQDRDETPLIHTILEKKYLSYLTKTEKDYHKPIKPMGNGKASNSVSFENEEEEEEEEEEETDEDMLHQHHENWMMNMEREKKLFRELLEQLPPQSRATALLAKNCHGDNVLHYLIRKKVSMNEIIKLIELVPPNERAPLLDDIGATHKAIYYMSSQQNCLNLIQLLIPKDKVEMLTKDLGNGKTLIDTLKNPEKEKAAEILTHAQNEVKNTYTHHFFSPQHASTSELPPFNPKLSE